MPTVPCRPPWYAGADEVIEQVRRRLLLALSGHRRPPLMSAFGGIADMAIALRNVR